MLRDANEIVRERQAAIRRELDRRGLSLKTISFDSRIPYSTLVSYFPADSLRQPVMLPVSAAFALCGALPDDLINLLAPDGYAIVRVPAGIDYDEVSRQCRDFLSLKEEFHHPESEAGRDLGPTEEAKLSSNVVALKVA